MPSSQTTECHASRTIHVMNHPPLYPEMAWESCGGLGGALSS
jgi:hypothetical protein